MNAAANPAVRAAERSADGRPAQRDDAPGQGREFGRAQIDGARHRLTAPRSRDCRWIPWRLSHARSTSSIRPILKLFNAGVVVRARRRAGGAGDTVVKLRPVDPDDIPQDLKNDAAFNIEVDALPGGFVCSASYKGRSNGQLIRDAVSGKKRLSKIFSKAQRAFYKAHAGGIDMDSLVPARPDVHPEGPLRRADGARRQDDSRRMVAEVWLYPDGSRILELSTKCLPADALAVAAETRAFLVDHHVPTNAAQETKTRTALEFYSKALATEEAEEKAAARRAPAKRPAAKAAAPKGAPGKPAAASKAVVAKSPAAKPAASKAVTG